jgi:hypothetical protein
VVEFLGSDRAARFTEDAALEFSLIDGPTPFSPGAASIVAGIALVFGAVAVFLLSSAHRDEGVNNYSIAQTPSGFKPWRRSLKVMFASACFAIGGSFMSILVIDGVKFF